MWRGDGRKVGVADRGLENIARTSLPDKERRFRLFKSAVGVNN
jgi:hypothetical protein